MSKGVSMNIDKNTEHIKEIPYGISDYGRFRNHTYYYVDKTPYLSGIQKAGQYLFFLRPRRFGKTLFLSMMQAYYDIHYKDQFEELFKETWIYSHPTADRNQYLMILFNFAMVDSSQEKLEESFLNHVRLRAVSFIQKYSQYLAVSKKMEFFAQKVETSGSASDILANLMALCKEANQHLYVIIDEYDNFTNTILSTVGKKAYHNLTHGTGFFRSFFNLLKGGTSEMDAPISRLFITGVSPITMDDVTSGFNIGKNISTEPNLNAMLGFTQPDVIGIIEYFRSKGLVFHPTDYLLNIMTQWYGNYLFSEYGNDPTRMFNSDMVLYFIDHYLTKKGIPADLIDTNVRIDYGKLRYLIILDQDKTKTTNGNFSKLKEIVQEGSTAAKIVKGFPLEKLLDSNNFKSLLFYFGLLTIKGPDQDKLRLEIPNETARRLYYDYISAAYEETGVFAINLSQYADLMSNMAYNGEWLPLFNFITAHMRESVNLRDLITGEKSIQAFLNVYLGLSELYIIHTERELNKGYADIFMEPFLARYEGIQYAYLIELKYLPAGCKISDTAAQKLKTEAETQLVQYSVDIKFKKSLEKTTLIKIILIFSGQEAIYVEKKEEKD